MGSKLKEVSYRATACPHFYLIDPLSLKLIAKYQKISVLTGTGVYITNHLLFVGGLKLLAEKESELKSMSEETKGFFLAIRLEVGKGKSATNSEELAKDCDTPPTHALHMPYLKMEHRL